MFHHCNCRKKTIVNHVACSIDHELSQYNVVEYIAYHVSAISAPNEAGDANFIEQD